MTSERTGFTLLELLVVVAMIAMLMGAIGSSVSSAQQRARVQKATSEVMILSQAILSYENFKEELPTMADREATGDALGFLLGNGGTAESGEKIPALLMASLRSGGKMCDPWGTPYRITIRAGGAQVKFSTASGTLQTGYFLPNFYRLTEGERQ